MGYFTDGEILEAIAIQGDRIELGIEAVTQAGDPTRGLQAVQQTVWKQVRGYCTPEKRSEIAVANSQPEGKGMFRCYCYAKDVTQVELQNPSARIRYNGRVFQYEYNQQHLESGVTLLHELKLTVEETNR